MEICIQCHNKIATNGKLCNICIEDNNAEFEKCKQSPYYLYTNYFTVNGEKATTRLSEEDFNKLFKQINKIK